MSGKVVKNVELFVLEQVLGRYAAVKHVKLGWCLGRNRSIIQPILEDVRAMLKPTEDMLAYSKSLGELREKHAEMDNKGRPVQTPVKGRPGVFDFEYKDHEAYEKAVEVLKGEHKQAFEDEAEQKEKEQELLQETSSVKFYKMPLSKVPEDVIMMADLGLLGELGILFEDDESDSN